MTGPTVEQAEVLRTAESTDRWQVIHGEALAVLATLPDASVDAVITDPPYSSGGAFRADRAQQAPSRKYRRAQWGRFPDFSGDNRDQRSYAFWCALWLAECTRIARPGAPLCVFTDWRQLPTVTDAVQAGGWVWRGVLPWDKTEAQRPIAGRFRSQSEYVVWGSKGPLPLRKDVGALPGVIRFSVAAEPRFHLVGKPVEVMRHVVRIAPPSGLVLDPFMGSGTTLVAAILEGRRAVGIEKEADSVETARNRLVNLDQGNPPDSEIHTQLVLGDTLAGREARS